MDLVRGLASLPLTLGPTAATVGFFDGVHLGHQAVLTRTLEAARDRGVPAVAVTFDRHPREVFAPGTEPPLITTLERRSELIAACGIDVLVVLEFTPEFAAWPAEDFVTGVLVEGLGAAHVAVGVNFTYGHRALGTVETLIAQGRTAGFTAEGVPLVEVEGRTVSSSAVRAALTAADLEWVGSALGRRFVVDGRVRDGAGRGVGLGFPTANLEVAPRMQLPMAGIYAGRARVGGVWHAAAIDVGTNPTFGAEPLHVEAHLLDFDGRLRGRQMAVELWRRLRDEVAFDSTDALVRQMRDDVDRTRAIVDPAAATADVDP